jgi:glycyl-tRNA synthetase (class II)
VFADRQQQAKADRFNEVDQQSVKSIQPILPQPVALPAETASVKSSKSKALSKRSRASLVPDKADENRKKIMGLVSKLNDSELERVSELLQEQVQCEPAAAEEDAESIAQSVA